VLVCNYQLDFGEFVIRTALIKKYAKKSRHHHFHHVVFLTKGGNIVSVGWNLERTHAEVSALGKIWPSEREGLCLWSFRVGRSGKLAMAKPCSKCQKIIQQSGISSIRFSDSSGKICSM